MTKIMIVTERARHVCGDPAWWSDSGHMYMRQSWTYSTYFPIFVALFALGILTSFPYVPFLCSHFSVSHEEYGK